MLAVQRKRAREPTPPPVPLEALELPSPLDFLRSKRRKSDQPTLPFTAQTPEGQGWQGDYFTPSRPPLPPTTLSEVDAGVERRRMKAWERRNADPLPSKWGSQPSSTLETPAPVSGIAVATTSSSPQMARAYSEPDATARHHLMSSSPIRHQPFDSSPFRERDSSSSRTRVDPDAEGWDMAEVERAWGEEYMNQNSLLYSLHRARREAASQTPDQTMIQTPVDERPPPTYTPSQSTHPAYDYRHYRDTPPSSTHYTSSSPFAHTRASSSNAPMLATPEHEDEGMEVLQDLHVTERQLEVQRRYEEANRLLGELEVARRQRWCEM